MTREQLDALDDIIAAFLIDQVGEGIAYPLSMGGGISIYIERYQKQQTVSEVMKQEWQTMGLELIKILKDKGYPEYMLYSFTTNGFSLFTREDLIVKAT